ncbi:MAG: JAB domain-containing protein [Gemmataceae bacterium]
MLTFTNLERSPRMAELKITYRRKSAKGSKQSLSGPVSAAEYVRGLFDPATLDLREEFFAVYLNNKLEPVGWVRHGIGTMTAAVFDARIVFGVAVQVACVGVVLAHNHPSGGDPQPSDEDVSMTRRLVAAGEVLGVRIFDHIIVTRRGYFSFDENNLV